MVLNLALENKIIDFMKVFLGSALKTNSALKMGAITGIYRVAKESIFSDMNNLDVSSLTTDTYADKFGFTQGEVEEMLEYYGLGEKKDRVRDWYNGYVFGRDTVIYNPWSIINYAKYKLFQPYWVNTSSNDLIPDILKRTDASVKQKLALLMEGRKIPDVAINAFAGGATHVTVLDSHGGGGNFDMSKLDKRVDFDSKENKKWWGKLDESYEGTFFTGAHAMAGTINGFLDHTQSSRSWFNYYVNGRRMGELVQWAMVPAHFNVPMLMVSGDEAACMETRQFFNPLECVAVNILPPNNFHQFFRFLECLVVDSLNDIPFRAVIRFPEAGRKGIIYVSKTIWYRFYEILSNLNFFTSPLKSYACACIFHPSVQ